MPPAKSYYAAGDQVVGTKDAWDLGALGGDKIRAVELREFYKFIGDEESANKFKLGETIGSFWDNLGAKLALGLDESKLKESAEKSLENAQKKIEVLQKDAEKKLDETQKEIIKKKEEIKKKAEDLKNEYLPWLK